MLSNHSGARYLSEPFASKLKEQVRFLVESFDFATVRWTLSLSRSTGSQLQVSLKVQTKKTKSLGVDERYIRKKCRKKAILQDLSKSQPFSQLISVADNFFFQVVLLSPSEDPVNIDLTVGWDSHEFEICTLKWWSRGSSMRPNSLTSWSSIWKLETLKKKRERKNGPLFMRPNLRPFQVDLINRSTGDNGWFGERIRLIRMSRIFFFAQIGLQLVWERVCQLV